MVEEDHPDLSVVAQCRLLSIPRSTFYHRPAGESAGNLDPIALIDRQFMETPFFGVNQMTRHLRNKGHAVNPKRVRRLMRLMPIYRRPNTSRPAKGRRPYPYLLRGHHLHPHGARLSLPRGGHGLAQPPDVVYRAGTTIMQPDQEARKVA